MNRPIIYERYNIYTRGPILNIRRLHVIVKTMEHSSLVGVEPGEEWKLGDSMTQAQ